MIDELFGDLIGGFIGAVLVERLRRRKKRRQLQNVIDGKSVTVKIAACDPTSTRGWIQTKMTFEPDVASWVGITLRGKVVRESAQIELVSDDPIKMTELIGDKRRFMFGTSDLPQLKMALSDEEFAIFQAWLPEIK